MAAANASSFQRQQHWLIGFGYYQKLLRMRFAFWHARYFYAEFLKLWSAIVFIAIRWTLTFSEPGPGLAWLHWWGLTRPLPQTNWPTNSSGTAGSLNYQFVFPHKFNQRFLLLPNFRSASRDLLLHQKPFRPASTFSGTMEKPTNSSMDPLSLLQ